MKDVQCYELFGGIARKNHAFSFHFNARQIVLFLNGNVKKNKKKLQCALVV